MEFDIRRYWRLVTRWWWLLAIGAIVPVFISYRLLSQQPKVYEAKTVLIVGTTLEQANPDTREMGNAWQLARGYAEMIRLRHVTSEVIDRLGLTQSPGALANQIQASVRMEANLLEIRVTDMNPEAAAQIANTLAEVLIEQSPAAQVHGEQQQFVERQLRELRAKIEQVEKQIEEQSARLANLTSAAERQDAQENLSSLEVLLARYRETHASYMQSYAGEFTNQLRVIEEAVLPPYPKGGNKLLILGVAGLSGIGLALGGAFLIEYLDDTLQSTDSQSKVLAGVPVLGSMGRMPSSKEALFSRPQARSTEAERMRALRTTVLFQRRQHPYQTLLITSSASGEGKSFVAANLGVAMADAGLKVILVDADMRKPTLHKLFVLPNVVGLADLLQPLTPEADIETLRGLQETGAQGLWLLSAGQIPLDPTMLIMSEKLPRLLEALQERADIILFDAPPIRVVPDASILASQLEAALMVVAQGVTSRSQLRGAATALAEHDGIHVAGIVFNLARSREGYYAHGYYAPKPKPSGPGWVRTALRRLPIGRIARPTEDDPNRLLPLAEVAERLGVAKGTVRLWARQGRLPLKRGGIAWRVRQSDYQAFVAREFLAGRWRTEVPEASKSDA